MATKVVRNKNNSKSNIQTNPPVAKNQDYLNFIKNNHKMI
jgi:hypothetical protein